MSNSVNMGHSPTSIVDKTAENPQLVCLEKIFNDTTIHGPEKVASSFKKFDHPRPYVTVIGFAVDSQGKFPIFFRSEKVRSARLAWSMPSGLHEVGLKHEQQFAVELAEELNLEAIHGTCKKIGFYEAIIYGNKGEDNWHWVLLLLAIRVKTLATLANKEPEKHSQIKLVTAKELYTHYMSEKWTMGLKEALLEYRGEIERLVTPEMP